MLHQVPGAIGSCSKDSAAKYVCGQLIYFMQILFLFADPTISGLPDIRRRKISTNFLPSNAAGEYGNLLLPSSRISTNEKNIFWAKIDVKSSLFQPQEFASELLA